MSTLARSGRLTGQVKTEQHLLQDGSRGDMATPEPLGPDRSVRLALQDRLWAACSCIDPSNTNCKQDHWLVGIHTLTELRGPKAACLAHILSGRRHRKPVTH